jgi:hypothetical protein
VAETADLSARARWRLAVGGVRISIGGSAFAVVRCGAFLPLLRRDILRLSGRSPAASGRSGTDADLPA